jgi:hypothetical protein
MHGLSSPSRTYYRISDSTFRKKGHPFCSMASDKECSEKEFSKYFYILSSIDIISRWSLDETFSKDIIFYIFRQTTLPAASHSNQEYPIRHLGVLLNELRLLANLKRTVLDTKPVLDMLVKVWERLSHTLLVINDNIRFRNTISKDTKTHCDSKYISI